MLPTWRDQRFGPRGVARAACPESETRWRSPLFRAGAYVSVIDWNSELKKIERKFDGLPPDALRLGIATWWRYPTSAPTVSGQPQVSC